MKLRLYIGAAFLAPSMAMATCPPILPCKITAEASTIAGSNADTELITFAQNITTSTNQVAQALMDMANANAGALNQSAQNIVSTNAEVSQIQLNQQLKLQRSMSDREMAHTQQMAENEFRARSGVLSPDDTKEEFQLIIDTLGANSDRSVPEIILTLQETMDKNDDLGRVMVPLPGADAVCSKDDIEESGKCAVAKRVYPGRKLEAFFKQCSAEKRGLMNQKKDKETRVVAADISSKKMATALEVVDSSGAIGARLQKQVELACTPEQFKENLCGGMSPEQYQEDIVIGNIIPGGDVSASNFNAPTSNSAAGYISDLSEQTKIEIEKQSLDRLELNTNPNQRVVPIQHTYRNANQVKSAMNFIDNIVADDLVPALTPADRRKAKNAQYQSRYLSHAAAMSAVRLTLTDSMSKRVGDKMRKMMINGDFDKFNKFAITATTPDNKESVLGASQLDMLQDRVSQQSSELQLGLQNGQSSNVGNDFVANPSQGSTMDKINASLLLQSEMMLDEALAMERVLVLESIQLSQKANSPAVVELMDKLRRGVN